MTNSLKNPEARFFAYAVFLRPAKVPAALEGAVRPQPPATFILGLEATNPPRAHLEVIESYRAAKKGAPAQVTTMAGTAYVGVTFPEWNPIIQEIFSTAAWQDAIPPDPSVPASEATSFRIGWTEKSEWGEKILREVKAEDSTYTIVDLSKTAFFDRRKVLTGESYAAYDRRLWGRNAAKRRSFKLEDFQKDAFHIHLRHSRATYELRSTTGPVPDATLESYLDLESRGGATIALYAEELPEKFFSGSKLVPEVRPVLVHIGISFCHMEENFDRKIGRLQALQKLSITMRAKQDALEGHCDLKRGLREVRAKENPSVKEEEVHVFPGFNETQGLVAEGVDYALVMTPSGIGFAIVGLKLEEPDSAGNLHQALYVDDLRRLSEIILLAITKEYLSGISQEGVTPEPKSFFMNIAGLSLRIIQGYDLMLGEGAVEDNPGVDPATAPPAPVES